MVGTGTERNGVRGAAGRPERGASRGWGASARHFARTRRPAAEPRGTEEGELE